MFSRADLGASLSDENVTNLLGNINDSVSKVVDSNGEPPIIYHGTKSDFSV
jgi:hypothetical protein